VDAQTGLSSPQIDANWFERALLKVTDKGADDRQGRLPVLITATWWDGDTRLYVSRGPVTDAQLYIPHTWRLVHDDEKATGINAAAPPPA